jgi:signal transduction histidine kinase/DNA-binding response OmpR family regulator
MTSLRILYLEDDPRDAELVQATLETEGLACAVTRVQTQVDFCASLERDGFHLILADYTLPAFDGLSALKMAVEKRPDVPFIFVSGTLGEEVAIEALKIGATDYVFKTRLSAIVPAVRRALRDGHERAERKRAEEALRQSEAYLAEAQRLSHTGSFGWSVATGEIRWSEETFRIFESDSTVTPTVALVLQRTHPDDAAFVKETIERASQDGKDLDFEHRLLMPDGSVRHVQVVGHAQRDRPSGLEFVGAVMDITERKRTEEALRQAQADLARVSRVTTLGELTASLAHEVRQPITAALTDANTCVRWLDRDLPDITEARAAAMRVVEDGRRATDIINRIRLPFTKGAAQRERVDMNDLVGEMIVLLRSEATRYAVSVHTALAADLPPVMADRVQLQQVLMNLIMNSIEAMKEVEGVRDLAIRSQPGEGAELMVSISDTGVGLPAQQADQIFNAFFTTKDHGIGLGLSISRSIVESHGGRLWAVDHAPRGASFFLTLSTQVEDDAD